ncbi:MAG TPA: hypothetical protein VMG98_13360 [Verrucomicrobiae bacterium]|nr:hypothetical protein [Verrucomicrobiae bacterium]
MLSVVVALATLAAILAAAIVRFTCILKLMREYTVDEYLTTPRARRLYITGMAMIVVMVLGITFAASLSQIWWVTTAAAAFAFLVLLKTGWALWMRFSGRYREFYRQAQWR